MRDKIWDWYKGRFLHSDWPGAAQILIQTRWHTDDLAGRLLNDQVTAGNNGMCSVSRWNARVPMTRWKEKSASGSGRWFTDEMVAQAKRDSRNWAALYQQSPVGRREHSEAVVVARVERQASTAMHLCHPEL